MVISEDDFFTCVGHFLSTLSSIASTRVLPAEAVVAVGIIRNNKYHLLIPLGFILTCLYYSVIEKQKYLATTTGRYFFLSSTHEQKHNQPLQHRLQK
jgi:hypothetical protein